MSTERTRWIVSGPLAAVALACDGGGGAVNQVGEGGAQATTAGDAALSEPAGTLTLGERTFQFRVLSCDLGQVQAPGGETLRGTGQTEDGQRLTVVVDRSGDRTLFHNVSLWYGAVMSDAGFSAQAIRSRVQGGDWAGDGPLVRIEGSTVRAEGIFSVDNAGAKSKVPGRLEAACP